MVHVTTRKDWRAWLEEHFRTDKEVWLVYYKKETGKLRISYNDAVEEALCFGGSIPFRGLLIMSASRNVFRRVEPYPIILRQIR